MLLTPYFPLFVHLCKRHCCGRRVGILSGGHELMKMIQMNHGYKSVLRSINDMSITYTCLIYDVPTAQEGRGTIRSFRSGNYGVSTRSRS